MNKKTPVKLVGLLAGVGMIPLFLQIYAQHPTKGAAAVITVFQAFVLTPILAVYMDSIAEDFRNNSETGGGKQ